MNSEKVKEILEIFANDNEPDGTTRICREALALINELESENDTLHTNLCEWRKENQQLKDENKMLKGVLDIANEREYRKKFNDEWRKEYQKELDKQGNGHIAGYPDFDLVYKLYFEQKDRIAELEKIGLNEEMTVGEYLREMERLKKDNELLRNAKVVHENVDYCYEDLKKAEKRIAELEKGNEALSFAVKQGFNDCQARTLKQFAERLKEKADGLCIKNDILYAIKSSDIDETLKEFL